MARLIAIKTVSLAALLELHKVLIQRRFRQGSPDGFSIVETRRRDGAHTK